MYMIVGNKDVDGHEHIWIPLSDEHGVSRTNCAKAHGLDHFHIIQQLPNGYLTCSSAIGISSEHIHKAISEETWFDYRKE